MDERVRKVLEELVKWSNNKLDYTMINNITNNAQKLLDEEDREVIFNRIKYFIDEEKYFKELKEIVENRDKINLVKQFGYSEFFAKSINDYWNNMDKLFDHLEYIIIVIENMEDEKTGIKTLKELTTENAIAQINLAREKGE